MEKVADASTIEEFNHWLAYIYDMMIGALRTGSMSRKVTADAMILLSRIGGSGRNGFPAGQNIDQA